MGLDASFAEHERPRIGPMSSRSRAASATVPGANLDLHKDYCLENVYIYFFKLCGQRQKRTKHKQMRVLT